MTINYFMIRDIRLQNGEWKDIVVRQGVRTSKKGGKNNDKQRTTRNQ